MLAVLALSCFAVSSMPVATFSIVARDPETGELGVAVQSHWFSVGSVVPWAEAGVGAVATQSFGWSQGGFWRFHPSRYGLATCSADGLAQRSRAADLDT